MAPLGGDPGDVAEIQRPDWTAPDDPGAADRHYRDFWRIDGQLDLVRIWSPGQWGRLPEAERPRAARPLSRSGWMTLRPIRGGATFAAEVLDHLSEYLSPSPVSSQ
jgi:hypothetical protein